ncbi:hypothetical protein P7C73_g1321, partial [Tremellales sp. Uapishka_1]
MSLVLPLPPPPSYHFISRSSTPGSTTPSGARLSRPCTPPIPLQAHLAPLQPMSAPQTPVTTTHLMVRSCSDQGGRDGRERKHKTTPLYKGDGINLGAPLVSKMEVDVETVIQEPEPERTVWGMERWGWESERKEVRRGVRLVGMQELPTLVEKHSMVDIPSQVMFPWLHGISDDGNKGREMGAFFGHAPPFEPPPYRGLCILRAPTHPLDGTPAQSSPNSTDCAAPASLKLSPLRERSETVSSSSESYHSTGTTEGTSPSLMSETPETDVAMHPLESKRVSSEAKERGLDSPHHPLPCLPPSPESDSEDEAEEEDERPSSILLNALHVQDIFDLPKFDQAAKNQEPNRIPRFKNARLPNQINLRNLHIQQIKYATVSDIILYAKGGVGNGVLEIAQLWVPLFLSVGWKLMTTATRIAQAQEDLWQQRMSEFYHYVQREKGEGLNQPVRYGVWVLVEPFARVEKFCPHLVNLDARGNSTINSSKIDLFEREALESRAMTRGSEVLSGFWAGNDCDVPGGSEDGAGASMSFDLCVKASEYSEMPNASILTATYRKILDLDRRRTASEAVQQPNGPSPATLALRNLLSPLPAAPALPCDIPSNKRLASPSGDRDDDGRCTRSRTEEDGGSRLLSPQTDRGKRQDRTEENSLDTLSGRVYGVLDPGPLVHHVVAFHHAPGSVPAPTTERQAVLLPVSLRQAVTQTDRSALDLGSQGKGIEALAARLFGVEFAAFKRSKSQPVAVEVLGHELWERDRSIERYLAQGKEHAGNAAMLHALGITHVVSVGECLINTPNDHDPMYGPMGGNTLAVEARAGRIQVLDLMDIRDDGNDPLRPLIARACDWIEQARKAGGCVLVHCRVGVSRSASIVIAYMMQFQKMGLMDAYLLTRARRLNVLIQPNLRFFHELFGWEVELARQEELDIQERKLRAANAGVRDPEALRLLDEERRRMMYSWPSFCRDLHCLNRRFLCQ